MSPSHVAPDPFEMDDAAYLLGALSPHERVRYEQHLQSCDACRRSLTELAGLPGVLRRLPLEVVVRMDEPQHDDDAVGADPEPPPTVLAGLLDRVEQEERRHRRVRTVRWAGALTTAAAAFVVAALAFGWWGAEEPPPVADQPPAAEQLALAPVAETDVSANVSLQQVGWGTKIALNCDFEALEAADPGADVPQFSLVVHDVDGDSEQVASFNAVLGKKFVIDAATAVRGPDIDFVEVLQDGTPVLRAEG